MSREGSGWTSKRILRGSRCRRSGFASERFDAGVAWELGLALKEAADKRGVGVALDISTPSYTLFSHAMDGATPDNAEWVRRKRNVTLRFHRSSYAIGLELQRDERTLEERHGLKADDYMAHGGCFPIRLAGSRPASARSPFPACRSARTMIS